MGIIGSKKNPPFKSIEELEKEGLLERERFRAVRAFQVEMFEDEGSQYFIELEDKRVLFLVGQYLYPYEPWGPDGPGDDVPSNPRTFPCVEFELIRHRIENYVLDVACLGAVIEPECMAPSYGDVEQFPPEDGTIFTDHSYDEIKAERMNAKKA